MNEWKRVLAGAMSALLVLQCMPYHALADEVGSTVSTTQTESEDTVSDAPQATEVPAESLPQATQSPAEVTPAPETSPIPAQGQEAQAPAAIDNPEETQEPAETEVPEPADAEAQSANEANGQTPAEVPEQDQATPLAEGVQLHDGTAVIPADSSQEQVKEILYETLV